MKSTICWFSGAGNSKTVAKDLEKRLPFDNIISVGDALENSELLLDTKVLGLVFPIYFFGPPAQVRRFILETLSELQLELDYLFVIFSHGGMPAYGPSITDRLLAEAGYVASYVNGIAMVDTYIPLFKIPHKAAQEQKHKKSARRLATIADDLSNQTLKVASRLPFSRLAHTIWEQSLKKRGIKDRRFMVTEDCTGCGICAKVCPAKNITIEAGRPVFHNQCEQCFACFHHCPEHAIRLNPKPLLGHSWYTPPKSFLSEE